MNHMPPQSDFSGKDVADFAIGSMTAARFWTLDDHGRMIGHYGRVWKPGVNVASCPLGCPGIANNCTCGFYGYHDAAGIETYDHTFMTGVIEAFGTVVVGDKGLRCSKAKIIGLHPNTAWQRAVVSRYYPDVPLVSKVRELDALMNYDWLPAPDADFWTRDTKPLAPPMDYAQGGTVWYGTMTGQQVYTVKPGVVLASSFVDSAKVWNYADDEAKAKKAKKAKKP